MRRDKIKKDRIIKNMPDTLEISNKIEQNKDKLYKDELSNIAKNAGIGGGGILFANLISYLSSILITRMVGAKFYGVFYLANTILGLGSLLAMLGLNQGVLRYVSLYSGWGDSARIKGSILFGIKATLIISVFLTVMIFGFSPFLSQTFFHKPGLTLALRILIVVLPFSTLTAVFLASLQALKLIKYNVLVSNVLRPLSRLILLLIFFLAGWRFLGLLWATAFSIFFGSLLAYYFLKKNCPCLGKKTVAISEKSKILKFSTPLFFEALLNYAISATPTLMLGYFGSSTDIGIYGIGMKLGLLVILPLNSFNIIFAPTISNLYGRHEHEALERLFKTVTKWIFTISFVAFLVIVLFAKPILSIFGKSFIPGANALCFIVFGQLVNASVGSVGFMLMMTGRPKMNLLNSGILCGLTIFFSYLLIPKYGIVGAAIAMAFSIAFVNILRLVEVYYFERIHPYKRSFIKPLTSGALSTLVVSVLRIFFPYSSNLFFSAGFCVLFLSFFIGFLILFRLESEDKYILKLLGKRLISIKA